MLFDYIYRFARQLRTRTICHHYYFNPIQTAAPRKIEGPI